MRWPGVVVITPMAIVGLVLNWWRPRCPPFGTEYQYPDVAKRERGPHAEAARDPGCGLAAADL